MTQQQRRQTEIGAILQLGQTHVNQGLGNGGSEGRGNGSGRIKHAPEQDDAQRGRRTLRHELLQERKLEWNLPLDRERGERGNQGRVVAVFHETPEKGQFLLGEEGSVEKRERHERAVGAGQQQGGELTAEVVCIAAANGGETLEKKGIVALGGRGGPEGNDVGRQREFGEGRDVTIGTGLHKWPPKSDPIPTMLRNAQHQKQHQHGQFHRRTQFQNSRQVVAESKKEARTRQLHEIVPISNTLRIGQNQQCFGHALVLHPTTVQQQYP